MLKAKGLANSNIQGKSSVGEIRLTLAMGFFPPVWGAIAQEWKSLE